MKLIYLGIVIIIIGYFIYKNAKNMQMWIDKTNNPVSYCGYLNKLCLIIDKPPIEIFREAGKKDKIPIWLIDKDYENASGWFFADDKIPDYLKEFLDEGKETIDSIFVYPN